MLTHDSSRLPVDKRRDDGNDLVLGGVGIGIFGVASAVVGGAVCPVCVVAAPTLLGLGLYRRLRAWWCRRRASQA